MCNSLLEVLLQPPPMDLDTGDVPVQAVLVEHLHPLDNGKSLPTVLKLVRPVLEPGLYQPWLHQSGDPIVPFHLQLEISQLYRRYKDLQTNQGCLKDNRKERLEEVHIFVQNHLYIFLSFLREFNFLFTLFSGDEKALMQWENNMAAAGRAFTVPENLSGYEGINLRRRSSEMQLVSGRNVVLNYGAVPPFDRSSKQTLIYLIFSISNVYYLKKRGSAT